MTQTPDGATDVVETRRGQARMPLFIEIDTVLHRLLILAALTTAAALHAEDWLRFRGPNGSGISPGSVVEKPSFENNLVWKTDVAAGTSRRGASRALRLAILERKAGGERRVSGN